MGEDRARRSAPLTPVAEQTGELTEAGVRLEQGYAETTTWWLACVLAFLRAVPALVAIGATTALTAYGFRSSAAQTDDEGTYLAQAWSITHLGSLSQYTYWYDHPPVGWITLALLEQAISPFLSFGTTLETGRAAMLPVTLASATLLYVVARRAGITRGYSTVTVLLFGLSPLAIQFHRMVLLDNFAGLWTLAAMAFALTPARRIWATAACGSCLALAVLSKEAALLLLPAMALLVWRNCDLRTRRFAYTLAASAFVLVVSVYPLYAALKSELLAGSGHVSIESALRWQFFQRQTSGSVLTAHSRADGIVRGWLAQDRWLLAGAFVALPFAAIVRRLQPFALAFGTLALIPVKPGYLPEMFVIAILPFAALLVGGSLDALWQLSRERVRDGRLRMLPLRAASPIAALALCAGAALLVAPAWAHSIARDDHADHNRGYRQALRFLISSVPHQSTLIVDDNMWLDLVEGGFERDRVVWMYKLRRDPAVDCRYPDGWRDFDYLVVTPVMRALKFDLPEAFTGLKSHVAATYGSGTDRYTILRIDHGSGYLAPSPRAGCPPIP